MPLGYQVSKIRDFTLVEFEIMDEQGIIKPTQLKEIAFPPVDAKKGIILSGKGPMWLYGFLASNFKNHPFVAFNDPRLGGAVIVESNHINYEIGQIVSLDLVV